jgi:hypothetical protein
MNAFDITAFTVVFVTSFGAGFLTALCWYLWEIQT